MTDWDDYLAAARRLDTVRREAASVAVTGTDSVRAARQELATVRQRLDRQRNLLLALAGAPGPVLPTGAESGSGAGAVADGYGLAGSAFDAGAAGEVPSPDPDGSPPAGSTATDGTDGNATTSNADGNAATGDADAVGLPCLRALRAANAQLDAADAILSGLGRPGPAGNRPPVRRNALVYGSFAVVVLAVQLTLFGTLKDTVASMVATAAGAVLPLVGFGLSWVLIGLLFGSRGRRADAGGPFPGTSRGPSAASGRILRPPGLARHASGRVLGGGVLGGRVLRGQFGPARLGGGRLRGGRLGGGRLGGGRHAGSGQVLRTSPDVPSLDQSSWVETGGSASHRVDRTPLLGAAISLAPVVVLCAGLGTAALLR